MDPLDIFDEPEPQDVVVAPPPKPIMKWNDHPCEICGLWGTYGYIVDGIQTSVWRCTNHVWDDFLPKNRR